MALATIEDVETRLGRSLTTEETAAAESFLDQITSIIAGEMRLSEDYFTGLDPVPASLTGIVVGKVVSMGQNPNGLASVSETLGSYSYSDAYTGSASGIGLILTKDERRIIQNAIGRVGYGTLQLG